LSAVGFTVSLIIVRLLVVSIVPLLLTLADNEFGRVTRSIVRVLFTIPIALFAPNAIAAACRMALSPQLGLFGGAQCLADPKIAPWTFRFVDGLYTFGLACGVGLIFYLLALRGAESSAPWKKKLVPLIISWAVGLAATVALTLQSFTLSYALANGGPANATTTLMLLFLRQAFTQLAFGLAAAAATPILILLALLGLGVGVMVVVSGLRLETVAADKPTGLLNQETIAIVLLVITLLGGLGACAMSAWPLPWVALNSLKGGYARLGEVIPLGRVALSTTLPLLISLLFQIPIAYIGALGVGALQPLGKRSELLLLLFSPWLFVTVGPLSISVFQNLAGANQLNTLAALTPPFTLSVPMLFILTLFFKGREPQWRAAQAEGQPAASAFFRKIILPSLPLTALLAFVAFFVGMQELFWPLIATNNPANLPISTALVAFLGRFQTATPTLAAAVTLFWLPSTVFFFLVFGLFQILYLDRLALSTV
jgi:hypothetical protein